jgi:hypothetical protein
MDKTYTFMRNPVAPLILVFELCFISPAFAADSTADKGAIDSIQEPARSDSCGYTTRGGVICRRLTQNRKSLQRPP